ncbi:hypothetical protein BH24DEI2_BH24DEI2_29180 [soil metagenome]
MADESVAAVEEKAAQEQAEMGAAAEDARRTEVFRKALGRRIGVLRKERGFNQDDFARMVNLHRAQMGFVEQGRSNPNLLTLLRIAEGLKVSLSELVDVDLEKDAKANKADMGATGGVTPKEK